MIRRGLLATAFAVALGVSLACGEETDPAEEIPDEAVQSDEAAPSFPSPEDSL